MLPKDWAGVKDLGVAVVAVLMIGYLALQILRMKGKNGQALDPYRVVQDNTKAVTELRAFLQAEKETKIRDHAEVVDGLERLEQRQQIVLQTGQAYHKLLSDFVAALQVRNTQQGGGR